MGNKFPEELFNANLCNFSANVYNSYETYRRKAFDKVKRLGLPADLETIVRETYPKET
jgi:hypothetical protein